MVDMSDNAKVSNLILFGVPLINNYKSTIHNKDLAQLAAIKGIYKTLIFASNKFFCQQQIARGTFMVFLLYNCLFQPMKKKID